MTRVATILGAPLAVLAFLWLAGPAPAQPLPAVTIAPAEITDVSESATFTGRAVAQQKVDIRARVSGFVEARNFTEGALVDAGAVLFEIEREAYQATLDEIDASIAAAQAELKLAEIERDRQTTLVAREATAQSVLDIAEANAGKAAAEVQRLQAQRDKAALDLSYTDVTAPFAGRTGLASVDVGALVGPDSPPLVTLVRTDPMTVEFPVPERDILTFQRQVASGEASRVGAVSLRLADGTTYGETGDVDFANVEVSQGTDTILIRAVFPNPDGVLTDGALVRVTLKAGAPQQLLTVPQQAVQRDLQGSFVLVVGQDGVVEQRRVVAGGTSEGRTAIETGLQPDEQVIVDGLNKARPGAKVDAALASAIAADPDTDD